MADTTTAPPAPPAAVSVSEAARQLGISVRQVHYFIDNGTLIAVRHPTRTGLETGGRITVEQTEIDRYKAEHRTSPATP